jgi:hypothetical protein
LRTVQLTGSSRKIAVEKLKIATTLKKIGVGAFRKLKP